MKAFRKAVDMALWIFGAKTGRTLSRTGKDGRPAQPTSGAVHHSQTSFGQSGAWNINAETRPNSELERYSTLHETLETRVSGDRGWLKCLRGVDVWQSLKKLEDEDLPNADRLSFALSAKLFDLVSHFSAGYNDLSRTVISLTPISQVSERRKVSRSPGLAQTTESVVYARWRASTASWALSCRGRSGIIELFLVPASDLMALSHAEAPLRLKLRLELMKVASELVWTCDGLPISPDDLRVLMRMYFRDLVSITQDQEQPVQSISGQANVNDAKLARSIEQLIIERENLAQKVVIQQEEIQKRIARDLHDAVISDVMALKRNIAGEKPITPKDALNSLEIIVRKLREICYDLSPRDLSDWGLATVVEDMMDQMTQRTGIDCELNCEIEIPVVPAAVLLHIYRIIQESLNNAEKYAEPSRVVVTMEMDGEQFRVTIADNGKGFDMEASGEKAGRAGGYGMGSLRERADLIRCFYPTKFSISSELGKGCRVQLEIDLASFH